MNQSRGSPFSPYTLGHRAHPHRASAGPDCCVAGASGPAMQRGGGSKLKGLLRVPLRLPSSSALLPLRNRGLTPSVRHTTAWPCELVAQGHRTTISRRGFRFLMAVRLRLSHEETRTRRMEL